MAEQLFWQVLDHLGKETPGFVQGRSRGAVGGGVKMLLARRFENVGLCPSAGAKTATGF
jgi:hypothetical protein